MVSVSTDPDGNVRMLLHPIPARPKVRMSQARNFVLSLLDALNIALPTVLLFVMITACAWQERWI